MKKKEFKYKKKSGETNEYNLLVLNENSTHISGIDLSKLDNQKKQELEKIQLEYEEKLSPFMNSFRNFIKENILEEVKN